MVLNKVPNELKVTITKRLKDSWNFDALLRIFNEELQIREKCVLYLVGACHSSFAENTEWKTRDKLSYRTNQATTATLFSGGENSMVCIYCDGNHRTYRCTFVTNYAARKKSFVERKGAVSFVYMEVIRHAFAERI